MPAIGVLVTDTGSVRRLVGALAAVLMACAACTGGSSGGDDARPEPAVTTPSAPALSLASVGIDWPAADGSLSPGDPPSAPDGFDPATLTRMAGILTDWAQVSTLDEDARYSATPIDQVAAALPGQVGTALREQTKGAVSPGLAVANVFGDEVTIVGAPRVTTAWQVSTDVDDAGQQFVLLQLQTRAAYEVRLGDGAPTRVIGVLRVHGLSAYPGTTDDFGVSGGWQEFGAADCALALDDDLLPDADLDASKSDLKAFVAVGDGTTIDMPSLGADEQVNADYLRRCRDGRT